MTTKKLQGIIALIITTALVAGILPFNLLGVIDFSPIRAEAATAGAFTVEGDTSGYSYANGILTISGGGEYTIGMANPGTTTSNTILVTSSTDVTITIDSLLISTDARSPFQISCTGNVTLKLKGSSRFSISQKYNVTSAGIQKSSTANMLTITSASGDKSWEGSLSVTGSYYGAAIGGGFKANGNNITIAGGTITATSSSQVGGAGIGGGYYGEGSNITITGGVVTASGNRGAGIGGGTNESGYNIYIKGGNVVARSSSGASIGSGGYYADRVFGVNIVPQEGRAILARGRGSYTLHQNQTRLPDSWEHKYYFQSIEVFLCGPFYVIASDLTDDSVTYSNNITNIAGEGTYTIRMVNTGTTTTTDTIKVTSATDVEITLDSVLISTNLSRPPFEINSTGNVTLKLLGESKLENSSIGSQQPNRKVAGLQKTSTANTLTITSASGDGSEEGKLSAKGSCYGAAIGCGREGDAQNITIAGGTIVAEGYYGAGIGVGYYATGKNINITGGNVTATSYFGAGIGGGSNCPYIVNNINISGGTVNAKSTYGGAGIGAGYTGHVEYINITGGNVTATAGGWGAGIGGGMADYANGGNGLHINISGGTVVASSRDYGAGIGGGCGVDYNSSNEYFGGIGAYITISGGEVTATSGSNGVGLGDGYNPPIYLGDKSNKISPPVTMHIHAQYEENGPETIYATETDITDIANSSSYFHSWFERLSGDFTVEGDWSGYAYENNVLTVSGGGEFTIGMKNVGTTTTRDTIVIDSSEDVTIILDSVLINNGSKPPIEITGTANVTIKLVGTTELTAASNNGALQKTTADNSLYITSDDGTGVLKANANSGSAISGDNITIYDGNITAVSSTGNGLGSAEAANIVISPVSGKALYTRYSADGIDYAYYKETNISTNSTASNYFSCRSTTHSTGDFIIEGNSSGYTYTGNILDITSGGEYSIRMAVPGNTTSTDTIKVSSTEDVTITLDSVLIKTNLERAPIDINCIGNVTIKLKGESSIVNTGTTYASASGHNAGLQKTSTDNTLTITSVSGDGSEDGKLTATGGIYGAGIGGGGRNSQGYAGASNITIAGGTIIANNNGAHASGIGAGGYCYNSKVSNILITGGNITALSDLDGDGVCPAIGGDCDVDGIKITGGTVKALGRTGIGTYNDTCKNITITGGNITATGNYGTGIGGGTCSDIYISGGTINATGYEAGIGSGTYDFCSNIVISGGNITAKGNYGAGIGAGNGTNDSYYTCGVDGITITDGTVVASSNYGAGIGAGQSYGDAKNIVISGGDVTATSTEGDSVGVGYSWRSTYGTASDIYVAPAANKGIYCKYSADGVEILYPEKTDITNRTTASTYFHSRVDDLNLPLTNVTEGIEVGADALIITDNGSGGTSVYIDVNSDGTVDSGDTLLASGNLTERDINYTGSLVTVLGGSIATLTGDSNQTVLNLSGSPILTIDLTKFKDNVVNVTGAVTSADGNIKLTGATAGSTVAKATSSQYMTISDGVNLDKAFTAEGFTLASYNSDNTVRTFTDVYGIELSLADTITDINVGESFNVNVVVNDGNSTIDSVKLSLTGDWYTVEGVTTTGTATIDGKVITITGLNLASGSTVATLNIKAANVATTQDAEIGVNIADSYIVPDGTPTQMVPTSANSVSLNLHNIKVALSSGNGVFDGDATKTAITAYAKYNEAGLYANEERTTALTMPTVAPKTGYRLADELWSDGTTTYLDNSAVLSNVFTSDTTFTLQTVKQWTVTIAQPDSSVGTLSGNLDPVTVDEGTALSTVVSGITFTPTVENSYTMTGWNVNGTNVSDYTINSDITATPVITACNYVISLITERKASVSGISVNDTVTYNQDVTFTVTPDPNTSIFSVYYSVNDGRANRITDNNGTYTIPGSAIVGNVEIEVTALNYYTVTFTAGEGSTMTDVVAYAWENSSNLYVDIPGEDVEYLNSYDLVSRLRANDNYRLAADTADEPLWNDGSKSYTTPAVFSRDDYTGPVTYTANAIKIYTVSFGAGDYGSLTGETEYTVDTGKSLTDLPTPVPDANYSFKCWDVNGTEYTNEELKALTIEDNITVTAVFEPAKYNITFTESLYGSFDGIGGVTDGYATYLTDVSFTFIPNDEQRIERVYYTVDGVEMTDLQDNSGSYTIPGNSITGSVIVTVETQETKTFTFATSDSSKGKVEGVLAFVLDRLGYLTDEQLNSVSVVPNIGYSFTNEWMVDDVVSSSAVVVPTEVPADRNITFYAPFKLTDFDVNYDSNALSVEGLENGYAHMGTDLVISINDGVVTTGIYYSIGNGETVALTPNEDNTFTIPGNLIIDNVTITADVVDNAEFIFITKEEYVGKPVTAFPDTRKIALLKVDNVLSEGNFALVDGRELFYSDRYGAYAIIVDNEETAQSMAAKLTVNKDSSIKYISYNGDLNGTGVVTAGDGGMLNDILNNNWPYTVTDREFLMMDVEGLDGSDGYQKIMTSDVIWILKEAIGLNG